MQPLLESEIDYQPPPQLLDSLSSKQHEAAVRVAKGGDRGIIWWKVGEGKTRIALCWMFYMEPKPKPMIICSPGAFRQWEDEIRLLKLDKIIKPRFLSYGMLSRKGRHLEIDFEGFNCMVIDELWMYKNHKSKRSRMVYDIAHRVPALGLSGSMVTARNIEDLYGQAKAVRLDEKIAPNITGFRREFCIEMTNFAGFIERYPRKRALETIQAKLAENVHIYFPKEVREIRNISVNIEPTAEQRKLRHELTKTYYYEHQGKYGFQLEIKSAAALLIKLQQISDGFLRDGKGHTLYVNSSKSHRLQELLSELLDAGERILVWVAFRHTATMLRELLPFPVLLLSSEHAFDSEAWAKRRADICIATVGSGASLNDFKNVGYALFYSTRFSHVQVQQAKGRTNRKSSGMGCGYYYYLQTDGFPDRQVFEMIEESRSTEEMVICAMNQVLTEVNL